MATLLEVPKVEYDLMAVESIDRSTDNIIYRVYEPDVPLPTPSSTAQPLNIVYSIRDLGEFFLLGDSYINIEGNFSKADGADLVNTNNPALECASTSFFSQSRLRLNSQLIEDNSTLSHINAFVRQLTTLSPDFVSTCGSNTNFILDENTGYAEDVEFYYEAPAGAAQLSREPTYNGGYRKRRLQAGAGETKSTSGADQLTGKVHRSYCVRLSDLFSAANCRKVMKNVSLRVELTTRTQAEMIFSDDETTSTRFNITKMQLVIAVHNPALDQLSRMESDLASGQDINYQYLKYTTYESAVQQATAGSYSSFTFNTSSQKPIACFLTTQRIKAGGAAESAYNGMIFDNCNLNGVRVKVNGRQYPYTEYEPSFYDSTGDRKSKIYARPYEELLRYMAKNYDINSGALITSDQWALLYPLYYIAFHNLPPSPSYSLTAELKCANATFPALDGTRDDNEYKVYLTVLTVGEFTISGDRSGVIVRSQ